MSHIERSPHDPENSPDNQNPVTTQTEKIPLRKVILPFAAAGIIGFTVGSWHGEQEDKKRLDDIFGKTVYRPFDPNSLNTQSEADLVINNLGLDIWIFSQKLDDLNKVFFEFAIRPESEKLLDIFHQMAFEHLFEGLQLLNQAQNQKIAEFIKNPSKLQVKLDNHVYNLDDPFQFQIISALLRLKLNTIRLEMEMRNASEDSQKNYSEHINNDNLAQEAIIWLRDQKLQIGFTRNSLLFVDPQSLARVARTLKLLNQLCCPTPRIGLLGPDAQFGGRFVEKGYYVSDHTVINYTDRFGSVNSLVHELGHYAAAISTDINPKFSQSSFNQLMDKVETANLPLVTNKNEVHFYVPAEYRETRHEQYAYFFERFVMDGKGLRKNIAQIQQEDPYAANILQTEYDFFKRFFQGKEFVRDGLTEEELTIKKQLEKSYAIGQRIIIADTDQERPGVFLRPFLAGRVNTDSPAVFDGDDVEIIEGPFVIKKQTWDERGRPITIDRNWWRVRIYFQEELGRTKVDNRHGVEGWISEEWLGGKIQ